MRERLYVAGPMTGYPDWNFPAFEEAAGDLRDAGYEVTSPHEIDLESGFDPSGSGEGFDLRAALERDVEEVLAADGVALLDGWEESPGAVVEVLTAASQAKPARPVRDWLRGAVAALAAIVGIGVASTPAISTEPDRKDRIEWREDRRDDRRDDRMLRARMMREFERETIVRIP